MIIGLKRLYDVKFLEALIKAHTKMLDKESIELDYRKKTMVIGMR